MKATGGIKVKLNPLEIYTEGKDGITLGRMSIDKTFNGNLEAASKGEMLSGITSTWISAAYVVI